VADTTSAETVNIDIARSNLARYLACPWTKFKDFAILQDEDVVFGDSSTPRLKTC